jgi:hypothetical protein
VIHPLLMRFYRCSQVTSNTGQLDPTIRQKKKRNSPYKLNYYIFCLS